MAEVLERVLRLGERDDLEVGGVGRRGAGTPTASVGLAVEVEAHPGRLAGGDRGRRKAWGSASSPNSQPGAPTSTCRAYRMHGLRRRSAAGRASRAGVSHVGGRARSPVAARCVALTYAWRRRPRSSRWLQQVLRGSSAERGAGEQRGQQRRAEREGERDASPQPEAWPSGCRRSDGRSPRWPARPAPAAAQVWSL